jgi:uncharacterized protein YciI
LYRRAQHGDTIKNTQNHLREDMMKHFVVEITYTAPLEQITATTPEHRAFLKTAYDAGRILFSGPQVPRVGGMVVCKGESLEEIQRFFASDPYQAKGLAVYRFIEFNPVSFQPFIEPWLQ